MSGSGGVGRRAQPAFSSAKPALCFAQPQDSHAGQQQVRPGGDVCHCAGTIMTVLLCLVNALCWGYAGRMPFVMAEGCHGFVIGKCILSSLDLLLLLLQIELCPSRDIFRVYIALHSVAASQPNHGRCAA